MKRHIFEADHEAFRDTMRSFCEKEIAPNHEQWEKDSIVPREIWAKAGEMGLLGFMMPEEFGGGGISDFRFNAIVQEELTRVGASGVGFALHT
ncbi:MAG: acyl-CoA dehydrogenase family protein, partial [Aeromicrobium sp.]